MVTPKDLARNLSVSGLLHLFRFWTAFDFLIESAIPNSPWTAHCIRYSMFGIKKLAFPSLPIPLRITLSWPGKARETWNLPSLG